MRGKKNRLRVFIVLIALGVSVSFHSTAEKSPVRSGPTSDSRPNILLIMTDQQFADAMSNAGNGGLHTPNMDLLSEQGVRFSRAYCAQPLCSPSRGTIFSGKMPHETGITNNEYKSKSLPTETMGTVMSAAGYDCGYVGKWHLPQTPAEHGFNFTREVKVNSIDEKLVPHCEEFLNTPRDKPFLLVVSFINPHDICEWARNPRTAKRNGESKYIVDPPIDMPPPPKECPELPPNFEVSSDEPEIIRQINRAQKRIHPPGGYPAQWNNGKWRQYRWAYNRMVELVDMFIGQLLLELKDSGMEENTIVIFTSDHGDGYAAHRWNQKWIHYEESVRVPLIISQKGTSLTGIVDDRLVAVSEDLLPTLCDYAGVKPPVGSNGLSLKNTVNGNSPREWRSFVVSESEWASNLFEIESTVSARMLRTERYKYIVYSRASIEKVDGLREQLFDMENDPGEMVNLANKIDHIAILNEHRELLREWCRKTNDDFNVPEDIIRGMNGDKNYLSKKGFCVLNINPSSFNDEINIRIYQPEEGLVTLAAYDSGGSREVEVDNTGKSPGTHTFIWSGVGEDGRHVTSGTYFFGLENKRQIITRQMIFL